MAVGEHDASSADAVRPEGIEHFMVLSEPPRLKDVLSEGYARLKADGPPADDQQWRASLSRYSSAAEAPGGEVTGA